MSNTKILTYWIASLLGALLIISGGIIVFGEGIVTTKVSTAIDVLGVVLAFGLMQVLSVSTVMLAESVHRRFIKRVEVGSQRNHSP